MTAARGRWSPPTEASRADLRLFAAVHLVAEPAPTDDPVADYLRELDVAQTLEATAAEHGSDAPVASDEVSTRSRARRLVNALPMPRR